MENNKTLGHIEFNLNATEIKPLRNMTQLFLTMAGFFDLLKQYYKVS